jgi:hypothetical protein
VVNNERDYAACCTSTINPLGFVCKDPLDYLGSNNAKMKVYGTEDKFHPLFGSLYYREDPDLPHSASNSSELGNYVF